VTYSPNPCCGSYQFDAGHRSSFWLIQPPWDLIACLYYLERALLGRLAQALAPGGLLALRQPTRRNLELTRGRAPPTSSMRGAPRLVRDLEIVIVEESRHDDRHEARLLARRPSD